MRDLLFFLWTRSHWGLDSHTHVDLRLRRLSAYIGAVRLHYGRPAIARRFSRAEAFRMLSMTAAKPSSSVRRSYIVTSALSFGADPNRGGVG
jgi:hypothetical protein